ncbi:hypothetical protein [Streptomyces sp. NBC_01525]|uniref:hypothetical protein n=1 Tax=Streptomyces sp. NBC_01525 TaxID=2903893 RepID=UPI00386601FE
MAYESSGSALVRPAAPGSAGAAASGSRAAAARARRTFQVATAVTSANRPR